MFLHIIKATYIDNYQIMVTFDDNSEGLIDLKNYLDGEIFEPLKNTVYFRDFKIDGGTITWNNGADFAPEFLKEILEKSIIDN